VLKLNIRTRSIAAQINATIIRPTVILDGFAVTARAVSSMATVTPFPSAAKIEAVQNCEQAITRQTSKDVRNLNISTNINPVSVALRINLKLHYQWLIRI
jgi:hypothetical protein